MGSVYLQRPWLNNYPKWMAKDLEIPTITAIDMFENVALRTPGSVAINYFDSTVTYGELNFMANALAAALADLGINKGDRVALDLQNIPQFLISQYAAWKLGAIVVPLNPMYRGTELEYLLNDSGAKIVIALESTTYQFLNLTFYLQSSLFPRCLKISRSGSLLRQWTC
jgi:long-chain acyl-CoA synthetase